MKKFEYRLLDANSGFLSGVDYQESTQHLNLLGSRGWEVVPVVDTDFTQHQVRGLLITLERELPG